jgi:hypothetical protein
VPLLLDLTETGFPPPILFICRYPFYDDTFCHADHIWFVDCIYVDYRDCGRNDYGYDCGCLYTYRYGGPDVALNICESKMFSNRGWYTFYANKCVDGDCHIEPVVYWGGMYHTGHIV